jgi:hypothetical protein
MPERLGEWSLLGHGSDPVVADTTVIDDRVAHYRKLADEMQLNADRLDRIADGTALVGRYADALRKSSGEVARDLHRVVGRYQAVAGALETYEPEVQRALTESQGALDDAVAANGSAQAAAGMTVEQPAEGQTLTPEQSAHNDEKTARTNQAADALAAAKGRLNRALDALDGAGRAAAGTIRQGFGDGLKDSGWDRFVHGFMKFLKVLVKVLTYIAMALAVIALVIPGLGEIILAAGIAMAAVTVVAEGALVAAGEGTWADFGIAVAGLLTFGVGKLFGPAIQAGLKSVGTSVKSGVGDALASARALGRGPVRTGDDAIPLLPRNARPAGVPEDAVRVDHPDLGDNNAFRIGQDSWQDGHGMTHTPMSDFVGYKGVTGSGRDDFLTGGARRVEGQANGNGDENWKAFYTTSDREGAEQYAHGLDEDAFPPRYLGGDILRYEHGRPTVIVTPATELTDGAEAMAAARTMFGHGEDALPFMDELGRTGQILRNPTAESHEYVVPWSMSSEGTLSHWGRMIPPRPRDEPVFHPVTPAADTAAEVAGPSAGGLRERLTFDAVPA